MIYLMRMFSLCDPLRSICNFVYISSLGCIVFMSSERVYVDHVSTRHIETETYLFEVRVRAEHIHLHIVIMDVSGQGCTCIIVEAHSARTFRGKTTALHKGKRRENQQATAALLSLERLAYDVPIFIGARFVLKKANVRQSFRQGDDGICLRRERAPSLSSSASSSLYVYQQWYGSVCLAASYAQQQPFLLPSSSSSASLVHLWKA